MILPIRDHNPSGRRPIVTWALIAINIIIFILYFPIMNNHAALASFWNTWAMIPAEITTGIDFYTVVTSMFLHGGFLHLAGNMLFLWIFGDNIEDQMGHAPFLLFYLLSGLGAAGVHILSNPTSPVPTVGASGAIAGLMGAYLLLYPKARVDVLIVFFIFIRIIALPAWVVLAVWMAFQMFGGFSIPTTGGGVAYWAHIGGFVAGAVMAIPLWLRLGAGQFWHKSGYHPPHAPTFETRISPIPTVRRRR